MKKMIGIVFSTKIELNSDYSNIVFIAEADPTYDRYIYNCNAGVVTMLPLK
jgi:hypothetical protein